MGKIDIPIRTLYDKNVIQQKIKKISPFDFANSINFTKENLIVDERTEKEYNPFHLLLKDLNKFTNIILDEIKQTLKRGERVELRGFGAFSTNVQKERISRNPKTGEKVNTPEKKTIHFKMSKDLFKKINDDI